MSCNTAARACKIEAKRHPVGHADDAQLAEPSALQLFGVRFGEGEWCRAITRDNSRPRTRCFVLVVLVVVLAVAAVVPLPVIVLALSTSSGAVLVPVLVVVLVLVLD